MIVKPTIFILLISIGLLSCNDKTTTIEKISVEDIDTLIQAPKVDNSKYHTQEDTVFINTEMGEVLRYKKAGFNDMVDKHSEFFESYPSKPNFSYYNSNSHIDGEFSSELGQDTYYLLYAYFLKQRNGVEEFKQQRQKLIDIYLNINSLYRAFSNGGTYYGHQVRRVLAYAEYSIYLLSQDSNYKKSINYETYDISKQKAIYIMLLKQLIEDESTIDVSIEGEDKIEKNKKLNEIVGELDRLITDEFYLKEAQKFQFGYY